jgi:hypothetical protein
MLLVLATLADVGIRHMWRHKKDKKSTSDTSHATNDKQVNVKQQILQYVLLNPSKQSIIATVGKVIKMCAITRTKR